jgi:prevent-host-death family protein
VRYVSASDAKQRLAADTVQREPVTIKRQNREVAVVISPEDYRRLKSANVDEFKRFCDRVAERAAERGLSEEELDQLLND